MNFVKARDLVTFKTGKLDSNAAEEGGLFPFFTCAQTTYQINSFAFDTECVLLAGNNAGAIFPLKYYNGKFNAYQRTYIIETKQKNRLNIRYFYFFLIPYLKAFEQQATGATTKFLTMKILNNIQVALPEIEVQDKIAEILSAYDDLIETNNQRIATLEQLAQQIYKEWFVRMRFPGWENTPLHHGIPEEWEQISFGEIAKEVRRHIKLKNLKTDSIYIGLELLPTKSIALKNWYIAESINSDKLLFNKNEILFCKIRPYLHKVALAPVNGSCSSDTIIIKATEQRFLPYALQIAFCDTFIDYASITSKGTKMPRADWGVLKKFPIFKPSDQLIDYFNQISLPILEQINLLSETNRSLTKTRNLLLPRLISGKLTLKQASTPL